MITNEIERTTGIAIPYEDKDAFPGKNYCHPCVEVAPSSLIAGEKALVARAHIRKGSLLFSHEDCFTLVRTRTSIQVGPHHHLEAGEKGAFINHSCSPNSLARTRFCDTSKLGAVAFWASTDICPGNEITFDYATTEAELTEALAHKVCLCNSRNCRGHIGGYRFIPEETRLQLRQRGMLANHLYFPAR